MRHAIDDKLFGFLRTFVVPAPLAPACPEVPDYHLKHLQDLYGLCLVQKGFSFDCVVITIAAYIPKYLMCYVLLLAGALLITLPLRLPLRVLALVLVRCPRQVDGAEAPDKYLIQ